MAEPVRFHRSALMHLVRGPWTELWIATPRLERTALDPLLPHLGREGVTAVRVLVPLTPGRLAGGEVDLEAVQALLALPGCEVRHLDHPGSAAVYAAGPEGPALVGAAPVAGEFLDSPRALAALLEDGAEVRRELAEWWEAARPLTDEAWAGLIVETSHRQEARSLRDELTALGAFVRVSTRGTRRSRRLDPREFGAPEGEWGRLVRPVEVALFKLDEVRQAKEDLDAVLADRGLEWNGQYLVPRHFLEREWPQIFAARERRLKERLASPEGRAALKAQLSEARRELEAFFTDLYPRIPEAGPDAPAWIDAQISRVLNEAVDESILAEGGLEYRVMTILPEDPRSQSEIERLLQDPRLRSRQLTFQF